MPTVTTHEAKTHLSRYLAAVEEFLADIRTRAAAVRCDYSLIRTSEPVDGALVKFLSRRISMAL